MAWRSINITEVRLTPAEKAALEAIHDSTTAGDEVLTNVVGEFRDAIASTGAEVGDGALIPDLVRVHVINRTRWLWLCEFPQLKGLQTTERSKLNDAAQDMLDALNAREVAVPPPTASSNAAGSWNSENKIVMRTHPTPRPGGQAQAGASAYSNDDAPEDAT